MKEASFLLHNFIMAVRWRYRATLLIADDIQRGIGIPRTFSLDLAFYWNSLAPQQRKGADDGVSILREDQDRINTFARLSARLNDINAEIADKQVCSFTCIYEHQRQTNHYLLRENAI